jgi:hypothetical protein
MKIVCTPSEFATLVRRCTETHFMESGACDYCLLNGFCRRGMHIEDSNIVEIVSEDRA